MTTVKLSRTELKTLAALDSWVGHMSRADLAEKTGVRKGWSKVLKNLEALALVASEREYAYNRRGYRSRRFVLRYALTDAGRQALAARAATWPVATKEARDEGRQARAEFSTPVKAAGPGNPGVDEGSALDRLYNTGWAAGPAAGRPQQVDDGSALDRLYATGWVAG